MRWELYPAASQEFICRKVSAHGAQNFLNALSPIGGSPAAPQRIL